MKREGGGGKGKRKEEEENPPLLPLPFYFILFSFPTLGTGTQGIITPSMNDRTSSV